MIAAFVRRPAMTVMFVIYGVAGGLSAAVVTDLIQGLLTIVLSFLILPFALAAVGGELAAGIVGDPGGDWAASC